jgi:hypothetical protein
MREIAKVRVRYGYRKIRVLLNREGWNVSCYLAYRLYQEEGLALRPRRSRRRRAAAAMLEGQPPVRGLVVDDYEPFRRFVSVMPAQNPDLQVIGEVSDGIEAVYKAQDLQPALIVFSFVVSRLRTACPAT